MIFWTCFADLDGSRVTGMEASPIQPSEVEAWCRLRNLRCAELIEDIWAIVHAVDRHRMNRSREYADQERKKNANPRSSS